MYHRQQPRLRSFTKLSLSFCSCGCGCRLQSKVAFGQYVSDEEFLIDDKLCQIYITSQCPSISLLPLENISSFVGSCPSLSLRMFRKVMGYREVGFIWDMDHETSLTGCIISHYIFVLNTHTYLQLTYRDVFITYCRNPSIAAAKSNLHTLRLFCIVVTLVIPIISLIPVFTAILTTKNLAIYLNSWAVWGVDQTIDNYLIQCLFQERK